MTAPLTPSALRALQDASCFREKRTARNSRMDSSSFSPASPAVIDVVSGFQRNTNQRDLQKDSKHLARESFFWRCEVGLFTSLPEARLVRKSSTKMAATEGTTSTDNVAASRKLLPLGPGVVTDSVAASAVVKSLTFALNFFTGTISDVESCTALSSPFPMDAKSAAASFSSIARQNKAPALSPRFSLATRSIWTSVRNWRSFS
mmetsp:Transcript_18403/g.73815  ORF Transcript_18403/g.73815 Transcript_18403/m.73815 type:complete len:204 (-) Transcript_18403:2328-2939(-)